MPSSIIHLASFIPGTHATFLILPTSSTFGSSSLDMQMSPKHERFYRSFRKLQAMSYKPWARSNPLRYNKQMKAWCLILWHVWYTNSEPYCFDLRQQSNGTHFTPYRNISYIFERIINKLVICYHRY